LDHRILYSGSSGSRQVDLHDFDWAAVRYTSPPSHCVYTALPAILQANNIFFLVFKIAYRDVLQNGHQDLRSDIDVTELIEKQGADALAKQGLDSIDGSNSLLNGEPLERSNASTQARTDEIKNRKALKQTMTAKYQGQERVRDRASC
jgi:hypothetical protein